MSGSQGLETANTIQTMKQPKQVRNTGMLAASNDVRVEHTRGSCFNDEMLEARVSLHGFVISPDKIHAVSPST